MSPEELFISASIVLGLAVVRFGVPLAITWLVGKVLSSATASSS
jgi:hypothetical protein